MSVNLWSRSAPGFSFSYKLVQVEPDSGVAPAKTVYLEPPVLFNAVGSKEELTFIAVEVYTVFPSGANLPDNSLFLKLAEKESRFLNHVGRSFT